MRIVGGRLRGLALASVGKGDTAAHLRPTGDRVRESLFNVLEGGRYGDPLTDAIVLDLFAGTGALGLEALSRGARHVTFVEDGRTAQRLLALNIAKAHCEQETTVLKRDATRLGAVSGEPATLVFLDPPYGKSLGEKALAAALAGGWISDGAIVVWEERAAQPPPPGFAVKEHRAYGDTTLTILERA